MVIILDKNLKKEIEEDIKKDELIERIYEVIKSLDQRLEDINEKLMNLHCGIDLIITKQKIELEEEVEETDKKLGKIKINRKEVEQI